MAERLIASLPEVQRRIESEKRSRQRIEALGRLKEMTIKETREWLIDFGVIIPEKEKRLIERVRKSWGER